MEDECPDWELLHSSDPAPLSSPRSEESSKNLDIIEDCTEGMIRSDYFSLDNQGIYNRADDLSEDGTVESDNPSWIDPGSETRYGRKHPSEFWSDTSSDRSEDRKLVDLNVKNQLGFVDPWKSDVGVTDYVKRQGGLKEYGEIQVGDKDLGRYWSDSVENAVDLMNSGVIERETQNVLDHSVKKEVESAIIGDFHGGNDSAEEIKVGEENSSESESPAITSAVKSGGRGEKKAIIWWKVPFEFLKYCAFKVSPVWSFSVAAAVMGFFILGRRLYKMKKKSNNLQLKVSVDDKKVSQFMTRAARLNEAFSVVRRVPIVRPVLPAPGMNQWPMLNLR